MRFWKRIDTQDKTITVESYSHDLDIAEAVEITQIEFDAYIASLPVPIPPVVRDLAAEIDTLKADVALLKVKVG